MAIRILPIIVLLATIYVVSGLVASRPKVPEKICKSSCASKITKAAAKRSGHPIKTCSECCKGLKKKYIRGACSLGVKASYRHCYCQKSTYSKIAKKITNPKKGKTPPGHSGSGSGEEEAEEEAGGEEEEAAEE